MENATQCVLTFVTGRHRFLATKGRDILNEPRKDCMTLPSSPEITQLLRAWSEGEADALERLMPVVYDELHRLAQRHMAHEPRSHIASQCSSQ